MEKHLEVARNDLISFGKLFLQGDFGKSETPDFHREIARAYLAEDITKQLAIIIARGHAKCLSAEMEVLTADGDYVPVNKLQIGRKIIAIDQRTLKLTTDVIKNSSFSGIQKTYEVTTRTGRRLVASRGHRVLTFDGWKKVEEDLQVGDLVASTRHQRGIGKLNPTPETFKLIAHLLMEGGLSQRDVLYTNSNKEVIEDCKKCAESLGFTFKHKDRYTYRLGGIRRTGKQYANRVNIAREWVETWGIMGHTALTKRVPKEIFRLSDKILWEFINIVMVTDGWFAVESGCAGVTLANEGLIDDLRKMFHRVGIITTKFYRPTDHAGAWTLQFSRTGIGLLVRKCDLFHKRQNARKILEKEGYSLIDVYPNKLWEYRKHKAIHFKRNGLSISNKYSITRNKLKRAIALDGGNGVWSHYEEADVFWDKIISIRPYKTEETFDIETERHHNFIVDGLVVHNTTLTKAFILHRFLFHKQGDPPLFFGWVADSLGKSFRNVEYISQQIMFNERIKTYFGDQCGKHFNKKWTEQDIVLANDCTLISRSNARSLRGETKGSVIGGSQRYNVIILDDIENEENTLTLESRTKIKRTVTNAVYPALDIYNGRLIFNGTPVHYDSLCQNILDGWKKAIHDGTEEDYSYLVITYKASQPTMPGGVLWESYIPRAELNKRRQFYIDNNNLPGYSQEYELEPQGNENRIWTRDHYIIHNASYMWNELEKQSYLTWKNETFPINCFWGSDPATDIKTRNSDNSVIMVIAEDNLKRIFVLEYVSKLAIPQLGLRDANGKLVGGPGVVDYIFELNDKYHCKNGTVEDVAMTRGVMQDIEAEKFRRHRYDLIAIPTDPGGHEKINKIKMGLNTMFSYRLIHYRDEHYTLREQTENFGDKMKHDDEIETLLFCTLNMYPPEYQKEKLNRWNRSPAKKSKSWVTA